MFPGKLNYGRSQKEQDLTLLRSKPQGERSAIKEVVVLQPHLGLACPQPSLYPTALGLMLTCMSSTSATRSARETSLPAMKGLSCKNFSSNCFSTTFSSSVTPSSFSGGSGWPVRRGSNTWQAEETSFFLHSSLQT